MCKSILSSLLIILTASTTISTNKLDISGCNLVYKAVLAALNNKDLSGFSAEILNSSKNLKVSYLAVSYPSTIILG
jgi:hypothetical protein